MKIKKCASKSRICQGNIRTKDDLPIYQNYVNGKSLSHWLHFFFWPKENRTEIEICLYT